MCKPYLDYQKVNMNEELMIIGQCNQDCDNLVVIVIILAYLKNGI
jgi:hypothetical protein